MRALVADDEDASEILQDIWLRVLRALPRLRDPARLRAWLFGIARRALTDWLRLHYSRPSPESLDIHDVPAPEGESDFVEEIGLMHEELLRMPVTEREVLVLFYLKELNLAEVGAVLGVPAGTVKSRFYRTPGSSSSTAPHTGFLARRA